MFETQLSEYTYFIAFNQTLAELTTNKLFFWYSLSQLALYICINIKPSNSQHYVCIYLFIYLYIKVERLVSAVFGDPQAQFKNLFVQKLRLKIKKMEAFTLTMLGITYLWCCII
jgi:hypothetical protein